MRYIQGLTTETLKMLTRIYKQSKFYQVRQRAHCIILSYQKHSIDELISIFDVSRNTIYNWLNNWEKFNLPGLYNLHGRGRKKIFNEEQSLAIKKMVEAEPKNLNNVKNSIEKKWGIQVSKDTIKRTIKEQNMTWKRMRRVSGKKPSPKLYEHKLKALVKLKILESLGILEIRYVDESGFSLISSVPYGWQEINDQIEIKSEKSQRINVLGFLSKDHRFDSYIFNGGMNANTVSACIDNFCQKITKKTLLILDNSSVHRNKLFRKKQKEWHKKGLTIFFLPPYSPQLNIIEILWRFIKYQWLPIDAYESFEALTNAVEEILANVGDKYTINFA
jgi:transposase